MEQRESRGTARGWSVIGTRLFGWLIVAALAAFLTNCWLSFVLAWPGALADDGFRGWLQAALYPAAGVLAAVYVLATADLCLRRDGARLTAFVTWLVRGAFFAVLLIGTADAAISFLRIEGLLAAVVGEHLATELGRPQYRGLFVHIPLLLVGFVVGSVARRTLGFHWLALLVVVAELAIVISRFVFSYEQAFMGDLVRFWYAALFLFASAYTLVEDGHVRVDILYVGLGSRGQGAANAVGAILLGMTFCWTILLVGFANRSAVVAAPLVNFEISQAAFGMHIKYLMAGFLAFFAITMLLQFVAYLFEAVADWRGEPGGRPHASVRTA